MLSAVPSSEVLEGRKKPQPGVRVLQDGDPRALFPTASRPRGGRCTRPELNVFLPLFPTGGSIAATLLPPQGTSVGHHDWSGRRVDVGQQLRVHGLAPNVPL